MGVVFHFVGFLINLPETLKFMLYGHSITLGKALGCNTNRLAFRFGTIIVSPQSLTQL